MREIGRGEGRNVLVILVVVTKKADSILKVLAFVDHDVVQQAAAKDQVRELLQIGAPHGVVQDPPCPFQPCERHFHHHSRAHVLVVEVVLNAR